MMNLFITSDPDDADVFITTVRSMYSKSEKFYVRSKEAEVLYFFFDHT